MVHSVLDSIDLLAPAIATLPGKFPRLMLFYVHLLGTVVASEDAVEWWSDNPDKAALFQSVHGILNRTAYDAATDGDVEREMIYSIHFAILSFVRVILRDLSCRSSVTKLLYQFLTIEPPLDVLPAVVAILIEMAEQDIRYCFEHWSPILPRILVELFRLSKPSESVLEFFHVLFNGDTKVFGNAERSTACCCHALSLLSDREIASIAIVDRWIPKPLLAIIEQLTEAVHTLSKPSLGIEETSLARLARISALRPSPDALFLELAKLADFHKRQDYYEEWAQTKLLSFALIVEYLTVQGRIPSVWGTPHPAGLFKHICYTADLALCPRDETPVFAGFGDSESFCLKSLFAMANDFIRKCLFPETPSPAKNYQEPEHGFALLDILSPLYEHLQTTDSNLSELFPVYEKAMKMPRGDVAAGSDRLFGHFFRVAFYGAKFGDRDKRAYIFREKALTHLYELSSRLIAEYSSQLNCTVELIKESGVVDDSKLDPEMTFIQITFVEPSFRGADKERRVTAWANNHDLRTFYCDTPFIPGSDKAQGNLDQQWIRRTLLSVEHCMPSITKLVLVTKIESVEFEPIRVAYRMLKDRTGQMETAVASSDYQKCQQLLHGSLLVQVNEGPAKMAEVFLGAEGGNEKYKTKLAIAFQSFLNINETGLTLHAQWVKQNPAFTPLQTELESGFLSLQDKLKQYL
jgi:hypothetical protein